MNPFFPHSFVLIFAAFISSSQLMGFPVLPIHEYKNNRFIGITPPAKKIVITPSVIPTLAPTPALKPTATLVLIPITPTSQPTSTPTPIQSGPTSVLTPTNTPTPIATPTLAPTNSSGLSGMVLDLFNALNNYRIKNGVNALAWDSKLGDFAQSRASIFNQNGGLDNHAGFLDFINNQDGFHKLGFYKLGENSSWGYNVSAVDLIEQVYTQDSGHKQNELNPSWSHVGIGLSGTSTDFVFGGSKM